MSKLTLVTACLALMLFAFANRDRDDSAQTEVQPERLLASLRTVDNTNRSRKAMLTAIVDWSRLRNIPRLREGAQLLLRRSISADDPWHQALASHYLSKAHLRQGNNDSAYYYLDKAQRLYLDGYGIERNLIVSYIESAHILNKCEDQAKAERMAMRALQLLSDRPEDAKLVYAAYSTLSEVYVALGDFKSAGRFQKIIYNHLASYPFSDMSLVNLHNLAAIFVRQGNVSQALRWLHAAEALMKQRPVSPERAAPFYNLLASCHTLTGEHEIAAGYSEKAMALLHRLPPEIKVATLVRAADYTTSRTDAMTLLGEAKKIVENNGFVRERLLVFDGLIKYDTLKSHIHAGSYIDLFDSIEEEGRLGQNRVARVTFKNDELLIQKDLAASSRKYYVALGISLVVLVLSVGLVVLERLRAREATLRAEQEQVNEAVMRMIANQQREVDMERTRFRTELANDIKNGVMSRLAQIKSQLRHDQPKFADGEFTEILDIQFIEREVRRIAHALNSAIFSENIGFNNLLDALISEMKTTTSAQFFLEVEPDINWDETLLDVKIDVYRIVQDLLRNSIITRPKNIFITIITEGNDIKIILLDDGSGIDFRRRRWRPYIRNIVGRLERKDGFIDIKPRPGKGTTIIVTLPHRKKLDDHAKENQYHYC